MKHGQKEKYEKIILKSFSIFKKQTQINPFLAYLKIIKMIQYPYTINTI